MPPPTVSITICMRNGAPYIHPALDSVFAQTFQDFEIILIDDGSTDGSADAVARDYPDARLRIIRQRAQTLRAARPAALAHSTGEFIAFIDHDDLWLPQKLERQVDAARRHSAVGLVCSDCFIINAAGETTGRLLNQFDDQFDLRGANLGAGQAHIELLRRGNFVGYSTAFARASAVRAVGGFSGAYQYVSDYDLWLRITRQHDLLFIEEPLAKSRVHVPQVTQQSRDGAMAEHRLLLGQVRDSASYPYDVRNSVGAALGVRALPKRAGSGKVREGEHHVWIDGTPLGAGQTGYFHLVAESIRRLTRASGVVTMVHVVTTQSGRAALRERLGPDADAVQFHRAGWRAFHWSHVHALLFGWQTHILLLGLAGVSWAAALPAVAAVLLLVQWAILFDDMASLAASGLDRSRLRWTARLVRFLWRRWPRPRGPAPNADTTEVIVWRGRFHWSNARHIAIIQDLTTRILPELHTGGNVSEFDEFLGYAQRHAAEIVTVSHHSRRDIIDRIAVNPQAVRVLPMPVHPQYEAPVFSAGVLGLHGIRGPYVLCVGAIEPRKNLRRLVTAFARLLADEAAHGHRLVLVGPPAWDDDFRQWLVGSDAYPATQMLGFVPLDHLPSLYHHATAVIMPSVYEGFGIPVLEAMCCSSVVLASNITSLPEVLGDAGITFDPYDTYDIAAAIARALRLSPADNAEFRARSRRRADVHLARVAAEPLL